VNVFQKCKILLRFGARRDFPANQAEARHKGEARIPFPNRKMQSLRIISEGRKGKMRFSRVKKKDSEQTDAMFSEFVCNEANGMVSRLLIPIDPRTIQSSSNWLLLGYAVSLT